MIMTWILCLLILSANSLTISVNNIHFGYRNIYTGQPHLSQNILSLKSYTQSKSQLTQQDIDFIKIQGNVLKIDTDVLFRQYMIEQVDSQQPELTYTYSRRQNIVLTLTSIDMNDEDKEVLKEMIYKGRQNNDL